MKRYRVFLEDFDTRATFLSLEISEDWEAHVREGYEAIQKQIREDLVVQYGSLRAGQKIKNFTDLGPKSFSVIAYHNMFAAQARDAFVVGAYFPALTSACALGERILNHLVINLRDQFPPQITDKRILTKNSFDNWLIPINALDGWGVLLPEVTTSFRALEMLRHRAVHFHPKDPVTLTNDRSVALEALHLLDHIIGMQFGFMRAQRWFIPGVKGADFIKKSYETDPFIQLVYLPNSSLVGPCHTLEWADNHWVVHDVFDYPQREISDEEFRDLQESRRIDHSTPCNTN